jgi:hypothetical protein
MQDYKSNAEIPVKAKIPYSPGNHLARLSLDTEPRSRSRILLFQAQKSALVTKISALQQMPHLRRAFLMGIFCAMVDTLPHRFVRLSWRRNLRTRPINHNHFPLLHTVLHSLVGRLVHWWPVGFPWLFFFHLGRLLVERHCKATRLNNEDGQFQNGEAECFLFSSGQWGIGLR